MREHWISSALLITVIGCGSPEEPATPAPPAVHVPVVVAQAKQLPVTSGDVIAAAGAFRAGVELSAQGRDTEAIAAYRRALQESPTYTEASYNLGNALARQLNIADAIDAYQTVLNSDSTHVSARHNLAALYVKQLNYAQAIIEHNAVLRIDPSHVSSYYDLGYIHFIRGEYERVEELLQNGQRLVPRDARFHRLLGRMRHKQLRYTDAVTALDAAVAFDSTDAVTYADLAQARLKASDFEGAVEAARRSIVLDANAKDPRFVLANALRRLGRGAEAGPVLEEFRALDEIDSEIRKNLRILGNDPGDHESRAMLGLLYARQGRYAEAAEAYRLAVSLAPDSARYHNNLGNYYVHTGDVDAAIGAYQQGLKLDPGYPWAAYGLGAALLRAQRFEEAQQALLHALSVDADNPDIHYHLGLLHARGDDFEAAALALEHVVKARPNDGEARRKLAVCYLKLGRIDESKEQLRRVSDLDAQPSQAR